MSHRAHSNIFTIAPGAPFLATLRDQLLVGRLIPGFAPGNDPLALADVTIYLPTRRAARELRALFAANHPSGAAILPSIRPLGELDEDAGFFDEGYVLSLTLDPPVEPLRRTLELAKLIGHWSAHLKPHVQALFDREPFVVPSTPADAVWMAQYLCDLMDEVARERGDWTKLNAIASDDLGGWWQLTQTFMSIVTAQWPDHLKSIGRSEAQDHVNLLMEAEVNRLKRDGSRGPVIAAGSTGSVPATADLLAAIAGLANGAVILPGLDTSMNPLGLAQIDTIDPHPAIAGHPQFGLHKLLKRLETDVDSVVELGAPTAAIAARNRLISNALLPPNATHVWASEAVTTQDALNDVTEIAAPTETQEALAIAIVLREAIEDNRIPAALVTADRTLARRVSAELERFNIRADDSGGTPLSQTAPAALFQLILDAVFDPAAPVEALISILKHPLARLGAKRRDTRGQAEVLELLWLRGAIVPLNLDAIFKLLRNLSMPVVLEERTTGYRTPKALRGLDGRDVEAAIDLGLTLEEALAPVRAFAALEDGASVQQAVKACLESFEAIGKDAEMGLAELYAGEAGTAFANHLHDLLSTEADYTFTPSQWPSIHAALINRSVVKPASGSDTRVHIWGALEARLQDVKTVVLGGLNEKSWPSRPSDDPFLSRGMKAGIDLGPPERRIGLAAHDFQMLAGAKHLYLTRSARQEGAPSVASRWLQRLHAAAGEVAVKDMQTRGERYLDYARSLDVAAKSDRATRPCPAPAVSLRPTHFSVTEIETLIRDPYAIHAQHILGLEPLQELLREPDAKERGQLFHNIVEQFVVERNEAPGTLQELMDTGKRLFAEQALPPETELSWWRRFTRMAHDFIAFETERLERVSSTIVEAKADRTEIEKTGVTLSGRADRIDILDDGNAEIIDYKTGSPVSPIQAFQLRAPQLPLEAALMARGAFKDVGARTASDLLYVNMKADGTVETKSVMTVKDNKELSLTAHELGEKAWDRLVKMIEEYASPKKGYLSQQSPAKSDYAGAYDHLARVSEWSSGGDDKGNPE